MDIAVDPVVGRDGTCKSWAFILIEKRRRTRTKVFIRGVGREGLQNQFCHSWSHLLRSSHSLLYGSCISVRDKCPGRP